MSQKVNRPSDCLLKIAAAIFVLFLVSIISTANRGDGSPWWSFIQSIPNADKLGHFGLMGILSLLCNLAFPNFRLRHLPPPLTATTFILIILVSLEEFSQAFIPTRSCDFFDLLADLVGLLFGQIIAIRLAHHFKITQSPRIGHGPTQ